MIKIKLLMIFV